MFKLPTDSLKQEPDVIMDFTSGEDKIDLSGMNLDYNSLHFTPNADGMLMHSGDFGVQLHGITAPLPSSDYLF